MEKKIKCPATGKTRFNSSGDAKQQMEKIKSSQSTSFVDWVTGKRKNKSRGKVRQSRAYYCKFCHGWHLTSKEYVNPKKFKEDRKTKNYNQLVVTPEKVKDWKKDSLPFPKTDNNGTDNICGRPADGDRSPGDV